VRGRLRRLLPGTVALTLSLLAAPAVPAAQATPAAGPAPQPPPAAAAPVAPHASPGLGGPLLDDPGVVVVDASPGVPALPKDLHPKSWLVADLDTGQVLAARDAHSRRRPASTLKTLTALTLIPLIPSAQRVPFTKDELDFTSQPDGVSSRVGLEVGRAYPARRLFEAMVVLSANDAAEALAAAAPGGRAETLRLMNDEARHLQAVDTVAATPSGLDEADQFTSAYDLALIARAALGLPDFREYAAGRIVSVPSSKGPIGGSSHNRLLSSYPGAYAGKDGYTTKAGQVWWGAAERGGRNLVVVVVDAGFTPVAEEMKLLDWGFAAAGKAQPVGTLVAPLPPGVLAPPVATGAGAPPVVSGQSASGAAPTPGSRPGRGPGWPWLAAGTLLLAGGGLRLRARRRQPARRRRRPPAPQHRIPTGGDPDRLRAPGVRVLSPPAQAATAATDAG